MGDWLRAQALAQPEGLALTFGNVRWTWCELDAAVDGWCGRLAGLGLCAGAIMATHLPNVPEHVMLVLAAARLGLVLAPLNTRLTTGELVVQLAHLKPTALICNSNELCDAVSPHVGVSVTLAQLPNLQSPIPNLQSPISNPQSPTPNLQSSSPFALDSLQAIVFTSGSTGAPKGVELTFGNHFYSAVASAARLGTLPSDCWLSCLPLFHVGGLAIIFRACLYGITVALHERFDLDAINAALDMQPITIISLVPTMLKRLLEARRSFPAALRLVLLGGAAADESLLRECVQRGIPVAPTYGLTEAASQVATLAPQVATLAPTGAARKLGSVGKPLLFTQVRVVSEQGCDAPANEIGDVVVRGPTVMRGYFNNPQATAHAIGPNGELHTGDLGYLDDDGDLWIVQRRSDLIVTGGENVFPAEVERALRMHPAVRDVLVMGLPDVEWGQRVAALVVLQKDANLSAEGLIEVTRSRLAGYKLPKVIQFVDQLPTLANGKIDRAKAMRLFG
jgi:O-succinylbenzoic acid--CoA ligase